MSYSGPFRPFLRVVGFGRYRGKSGHLARAPKTTFLTHERHWARRYGAPHCDPTQVSPRATVIRARLKIVFRKECGFDSLHECLQD